MKKKVQRESYWNPGVALIETSQFDAAHYLRLYTDVRDAGLDAFMHFETYGCYEYRQPTDWFETQWYAERFLPSEALGRDGSINAFKHYCELGNLLGLPPNRKLCDAIAEIAFDYFEPEYYLEVYQDVAEAKLDPWYHYVNFGWREKRSPAKHFSLVDYHSEIVEPSIEARHRNQVINYDPLLHFAVFQSERWTRRLNGLPETSTATKDRVETDASRLINFVNKNIADSHKDLDPVDAEAHLTMITSSRLFNAQYYAAQAQKSGNANDLARHYLNMGWRQGFDPSPEFVSSFYYEKYKNIALPNGRYDLTDEINPLIHYLDVGQKVGLFTNPRDACHEVEIIRASGLFEPYTYLDKLSRRLRVSDPIVDYVIYGHFESVTPWKATDETFIRALYAPIVGPILKSPLGFYLKNKNRCWVFRSSSDLERDADEIRRCPLFDPDAYAHEAGIEERDVDPATHYAVLGVRSKVRVNSEFDTEYYLEINPDIANARVNPLIHYTNYGKNEGRNGSSSIIDFTDECGQTYDPVKETCLIVSHEASRTGAPIVALNIARKLSKTYNIIVWIGKSGGVLAGDFHQTAFMALSGWSSISDMAARLKDFRSKHDCSIALVNSVVSNPIIPALVIGGIAKISLIHEFASYVYPQGTTSRMVLSSDGVVFPAEVVAKSCSDEMIRLGACRNTLSVTVRAQGYNTAVGKSGEFTADELKSFIRANSPNGSVRVMFGAGQVNHRKGIDLFLQAAYYLSKNDEFDWRFIWVGDGFDPVADVNVSLYLSHQIAEAGLQRQTFMFGEQRDLKAFWQTADVFFLSSRLDPFPNVAIDAFMEKVPLVCFEGSTGVAQLQTQFGFAIRCVPYFDTVAAAEAVLSFAQNREARNDGQFDEGYKSLFSRLSFESYASDLENLFVDAKIRNATIVKLADNVSRLNESDLRFYSSLIPEPNRLTSLDHPLLDRFSLASHIAHGSSLSSSVFNQDTTVAMYDAEKPNDLAKCEGDVRALPPTEDHLIHFFCSDAAAFRSLFDSDFWPAAVLRLSQVYVSASNGKIASTIRREFGENVKILDKHSPNGVVALQHFVRTIVSNTATKSIDNQAMSPTITHIELGAVLKHHNHRKLNRNVLECLLNVMNRSALSILKNTPKLVAVVPLNCENFLSAPVERFYHKFFHADLDRSEGYTHGLIGTFRSKFLADFLEMFFENCGEAINQLSEPELVALAGVAFDKYADRNLVSRMYPISGL